MHAAPATECLWFLGTTVAIHAAVAEAGVSVIESRAPYGDSPPLHVDRTEDEIFHVIEGELRLVVDDEPMAAAAGTTLLAPRGVPHTYVVTSEAGARWLVITARGDFERFVRETSRPAEHGGLPQPGGPPGPEAVRALADAAARHSIELVGPPLAP